MAVASGSKDVLHFLLNDIEPALLFRVLQAAELGGNNGTALHLAVMHNSEGGTETEQPSSALSLLCEAMANFDDPRSFLKLVDSDGKTPMQLAVRLGKLSEIQTITEFFSPAAAIDADALLAAATSGHHDVLHYLISNFSIKEAISAAGEGKTLQDFKVDLMFAGVTNEKDSAEVVEVILDYLASAYGDRKVLVEATDKSGATPLLSAVR